MNDEERTVNSTPAHTKKHKRDTQRNQKDERHRNRKQKERKYTDKNKKRDKHKHAVSDNEECASSNYDYCSNRSKSTDQASLTVSSNSNTISEHKRSDQTVKNRQAANDILHLRHGTNEIQIGPREELVRLEPNTEGNMQEHLGNITPHS